MVLVEIDGRRRVVEVVAAAAELVLSHNGSDILFHLPIYFNAVLPVNISSAS